MRCFIDDWIEFGARIGNIPKTWKRKFQISILTFAITSHLRFMKKLTTLVFALSFLTGFGQVAISGSAIFQDNYDDFSLSNAGVGLSERKYREIRIPAFAAGLTNFKKTGNYSRWLLSGWHYYNREGFDVLADVINAPPTEVAPNKITTAGGRASYGYGLLLNKGEAKTRIFVEPNISFGWQYVKRVPTSPTFIESEYKNFNFEIGSNLSVHRNFRRFFARVALIIPVIRFSDETYYLNYPFLSKKDNTKSDFNSILAFKRIGIELGGGFFFVNK